MTRPSSAAYARRVPKPVRTRRWPRRLALAGAVVLALVAALAVAIRLRYGGGGAYPDRSGPPERPFSDLEIVAALDHPPGNVAVSAEGRVFITFHPDGRPPTKVAELAGGVPRPYPDAAWQSERDDDAPFFDTPLSLRIDRQGRLWVLDQANHATGLPRLVAFDLATNALVHEHRFDSDVAPLGAHMNDFAVSPDGSHIYIADASIVGQRPAVVVYDVEARRARRVLDDDRSVRPEDYVITVEGEPQVLLLGLFAIRPGVDSIALDRRGEWLTYGAMTSTHFWRVRAGDLEDASLSAQVLSSRVERLFEKTVSDGITIDDADTIYVSDPEHSAIHAWDRQRGTRTLFRDPRLRWPDGFSFGPDGWVYVTCSALQHVILESDDAIAAHRPYHVYRFQSGATAPAGH